MAAGEETMDRSVAVAASLQNCTWRAPSDLQYQDLKNKEFERELAERRDLLLDGVLPLLLDQQGGYPRSPAVCSAWTRFGASLVDKRLARSCDQQRLEDASRRVPHAGYQRLLRELADEVNL